MVPLLHGERNFVRQACFSFFAALILLATPACNKKRGTPDWNTPGAAPPPPTAPAAVEPAAPAAVTPTPPAAVAEPDPGQTAPGRRPRAAAAETATTEGLRFVAYNVENWLIMDRIDRADNFKKHPSAPKPDKEKQAVIKLLSRHQPDVIGLCEIGTPEDLKEIQTLLKAAGLDLPYSHYAGGGDPVRHLGLLSRFPVTPAASPAKLTYQLNGTGFTMNRGIIDATVNARGKSYHFLGVHLKSKRDVAEGDQEQMRQHEAHLLRDHINTILAAAPTERLVVYGDFNDTWGTPTLKTITGNHSDPTYLTAIRAQDRQGLYWTHYWAEHDIYSRFDFIAVSQPLKPDVDFKACRLIDDPEWINASDHRPVMAEFR